MLATHYPMVNVPGLYFQLHQSCSYVLALQGGPDVDGMYIDEQDGGLSPRNYHGDTLLLGGGGHRTGRAVDFAQLRAVAQNAYRDAAIRFAWRAQGLHVA